ncbi:MAG: hypothetical protein NZM37_04230 [Sandaracinaceae bacterium]|nr:hypothetical protein [Sandaracinaceae bacterium]
MQKTFDWLYRSIVGWSLGLVACGGGGGNPMPMDGGPMAQDGMPPSDARPMMPDSPMMPPGGTLGTCAMPRQISLMMGMEAVIRGDTTMGPPGALDLGRCGVLGTVDPTMRPPQDVIAVQIPGSGEVGIEFSLVNDGTPENFDTVVQVRTNCMTAPEELAFSCFDDARRGELRTEGRFMARGGSTVYLIVTGFAGSGGGGSGMNRGPYELRIRTHPNTAPTLTNVTARRVGDRRFEIAVTGMDAESNALGIGFRALNAGGMPIALSERNPDFTGPYFEVFDTMPAGTSFTNQLVTLPGSSELPRIADINRVQVFVFDAFGARSMMMEAGVSMVMEVGYGQSCNEMNVCRPPNVCEGGRCEAPPGVRNLCMMATTVTLTAPGMTMPSTTRQMVTIPRGEGQAVGNAPRCSRAMGAERVLKFTVPRPNAPVVGHDLIATTQVEGTSMMTDTILYLRRNCADSESELEGGCHDDIGGGDLRSTIEVRGIPEGEYHLFVDSFMPLMADTNVTVELRLRPVLPPGTPCDPMGQMNRCSMGMCPMAALSVCPAAP